MSYKKQLLVLLSALMLLGCAATKRETSLSFTGLETDPRYLSGRLTLPGETDGPLPVVMLVHGSAGVDNRYGFHRPALIAAGMATFEVDFKTHVFSTLANLPPIATFHPWVFGALRVLRNHPAIDPNRIAIMGFSLGGHLAISAASQTLVTRWLGDDQAGFAAHVGFYPVCRYLRNHFGTGGPTGAPMLILTAAEDSWGDGQSCPPFSRWINTARAGLLELVIYPNVYHGFDRQGSWAGYAPLAHNQTAILRWDKAAATDSRHRAVAFLQLVFGL